FGFVFTLSGRTVQSLDAGSIVISWWELAISSGGALLVSRVLFQIDSLQADSEEGYDTRRKAAVAEKPAVKTRKPQQESNTTRTKVTVRAPLERLTRKGAKPEAAEATPEPPPATDNAVAAAAGNSKSTNEGAGASMKGALGGKQGPAISGTNLR